MPNEIEKECVKHGLTIYRIRAEGGGKYHRCLKCRREAVIKRRRKVKQMLVDMFGGKCEKCGYNRYIGALEFHHKNPKEKSFGLSVRGLTRSFEKLVEEAKKCQLLCANCHREETWIDE